MKPLKYLLLFIVFSIIGLFVIGLVNKKISTSVSVEVNAPIEKSFEVAMDPDLFGEWLSNEKMKFVKIEQKNAVPQPGTKYQVYFTWGKKSIQMEETVKTYIPNKEFTFSLNDKHTAFDIDLFFESKDSNHTMITEKSSGGAKNAFFRGMMALSKRSIMRDKEAQFDRLKTLIERENASNI